LGEFREFGKVTTIELSKRSKLGEITENNHVLSSVVGT